MQDSVTELLPPPSRLVIASRESRLALWQAEHIRARLMRCYPGCEVEILGMTTRGDRILDKPLAQIGGKGLFVKELELALQEGRADLAVHSLKDVPMEMPSGFAVAAIATREDPCDALVSSRFASLDTLPAGAVVGTSSLRREAILRSHYPQLKIASLRGNLDTRLRKLDEGQFDAIILASAGLQRLGLAERIRQRLPIEVFLPAPGQGALAIETVANRPELRTWLSVLDDPATHACVAAERAFSRALGGSCRVPLGALATIEPSVDGEAARLRLRGFVATPDGRQMLRDECAGSPDAAAVLGVGLAEVLMARGAAGILAEFPAAS